MPDRLVLSKTLQSPSSCSNRGLNFSSDWKGLGADGYRTESRQATRDPNCVITLGPEKNSRNVGQKAYENRIVCIYSPVKPKQSACARFEKTLR